jgi:hypothetical protein
LAVGWDRYEHAVVSIEGDLDTEAGGLAGDFMARNGNIARQLDAFPNGNEAPAGNWTLMSHDSVLVGQRALFTFVFMRPACA